MAGFVVRRLVGVVLVSMVVSALAFLALHGLAPQTFEDQHPLLVETALYLERVFVHFDLGQSTARPFGDINELIGRGLPADVALIAGGIVTGLALGLAGGALAATRPGTRVAALVHGLAVIAMCSPVYFIGMSLVLLFTPGISAPLPFFLVSPNEYVAPSEDLVQFLDAMVVPWLVCGLPLAGAAARATDVNLRAVLDADYVRSAVAKCLSPWRVLGRHALPVAVPPVLGLTAAWVPLTIGNAILIERVFGLPGMYQLVPGALDNGNYDIVLGMVVVTSVIVVVVGGAMDLVQGLLDPRVRGA